MAKLNDLKKLTVERFEQMIEVYSLDEIAEIVDSWWFKQVNDGYAIFNYNGTGLLGIEAINDVGAYDDDEEATQQAIKDGVKIIPVDELPENFKYRWLGWIDTPENRQRIAEYAERR